MEEMYCLFGFSYLRILGLFGLIRVGWRLIGLTCVDSYIQWGTSKFE